MKSDNATQAVKQFGPLLALMVLFVVLVAALPSNPAADAAGVATDGDAAGDGTSGFGAGIDANAIGDDPGIGDGTTIDPTTGEVVGRGGRPGTDGTGSGGSGTGGGTAGASSGESAGSVGGVGPRPTTCARQAQGFASCPPTWSGDDNGGATARGVTADKLTLVLYTPARQQAVEAILGNAGVATAASQRAVLPFYEKYYNEHFELYGRKLEIEFQEGPTASADTAGQTNDAVKAVTENNPFAVVASFASPAFHTEVSRRQVVNLTGLLQFPADFHAGRAPYSYGYHLDADGVLDHAAEYYCTRMKGQKAALGGSPTIRSQDRKVGIVQDAGTDVGERLAARLRRCGAIVGPVLTVSQDVSQASRESQSVISQFQADKVTTVACVCNAIVPVFATPEATKQAYFPEWLHTAYGATDTMALGRLYDQSQWANSFGITVFRKYESLKQRLAWKTYAAGGGTNQEDNRSGGETVSDLLVPILLGIEEAGPNLTPATLQAAMGRLVVRPRSPDVAQLSFGNNGPSAFTAVDDVAEIWWQAGETGPDGGQGRFYYPNGGRRVQLGGWPAKPPTAKTPDGSPQPARDPDA